jgi:ABC-2 type transport system permease protein
MANGLAVPLLLLSGVMLPMSLAPDWLRTIADLNPLYHAVAAIRALFNASFGDPEIAIGVAMMAALAVVTVAYGARSFSRSVA